MLLFKNKNITVFQSALFKTNTSVVETPDLVLVVDPNWLPGEVYTIRNYVNSVRGTRPLYLLFTHSDYDHIIGYKAFPGAKVIASKAFDDNPKKAEIIEQIRQFDDDYYIDRDYEITYPEVDIPVTEHNNRLVIGQTILNFTMAPGHNEDGLFTIVEPLGLFIAGDYLSDVEFPFIYFSGTEYSQTLKKAEKLFHDFDIQILIPGHGSVCESEREFKMRKDASDRYLNDLLQSVITEQPFDLESLFRKYKYPRLMKKFHNDNIALIKSEIAQNKA